jgi:hypothetical protein
MLSFIELGFYFSLAVMLCLLFLLLNHLKTRILTLEKQNEGLMDVMKMIRGNLVSADMEQKHLKNSVVSLAKNISVVSARMESQTQRILDASSSPSAAAAGAGVSKVVLEVEELYPGEEDDDEDDDDDDEDEDEDVAKTGEIETVELEWPVNEDIEIHKLASEADTEDTDDIRRQIMEQMNSHSMFMGSPDASELQKLFFMMSMGNGIPMPNMRTVIFENGRGFAPSETQDEREYEILPDTPPPDSDPDVEELPDSPMPELIPIDSDDEEVDTGDLNYDQLNVQIDHLIEEIVVAVPEEQKEEQKEEGVVEDIPQPLVAESVTDLIDEPFAQEVADSAVLSVAEPADEIAVGPETTVEEEGGGEVAEKLPIDFSKLDLRTLRTLVSTQGKASAEKVSKMKKNELIRILSSGSDSV